MANFEHIVEFEFGPSVGFHGPIGSIHTNDMCLYMRIDDAWYRIHDYIQKEISGALEKCSNELEFQALVKQMKEEEIITPIRTVL
mgnify:CR=1 FL=1